MTQNDLPEPRWERLKNVAPRVVLAFCPEAATEFVQRARLAAELAHGGPKRAQLANCSPNQMTFHWAVDRNVSPEAREADKAISAQYLLDLPREVAVEHAERFARWGVEGKLGDWSAHLSPGDGLEPGGALPEAVIEHVRLRINAAFGHAFASRALDALHSQESGSRPQASEAPQDGETKPMSLRALADEMRKQSSTVRARELVIAHRPDLGEVFDNLVADWRQPAPEIDAPAL